MPKSGVDYYRAINQQKNFAHSVGLESTRFTYPYSSFSDYQDDKSSHYYNADLKLVKSNSVGKHHEDCDEPECGTSNWFCDLCSDLNFDIGFEPAGVSEVYSGCGRSSVQCMLLLECDDEVSPIPHDGGTDWDSDLQLDHLRTDSAPVPVSDEHEPAVVQFAEILDIEQSAIDSVIELVELPTNVLSGTIDVTLVDREATILHQELHPPFETFHRICPRASTHVKNIQFSATILIFSLFLVMCIPVYCLLASNSILAKASLLTIALFPYTFIFVFDRGKIERGLSM